jgi:hypothetical protein
MDTLRLSLCMIVRDGAATLPRCLESVRGLADEIVVVDTGSKDESPQIARAHGADVLTTEWRDDFSAARNLGLARAKGAWILVLDADEWLPPESVGPIRALVARPPAEAFHLIQCSELPDGGVVRAAAVRVFPNRPDVRYRHPLHEEVNASLAEAGLPLRATPIEFLHSGYADRERIEAKRRRNVRIAEAALARGASPAEALPMRYYRGCFRHDAREWRAAIEDFAWCEAQALPVQPRLAQAARIQLAECWYQLGEFALARGYLPPAPSGDAHPLALCLGARMARAEGSVAEARRWYETLLHARDEPWAPPVDLGALRREAREFLESAAG